MDSNLSRRDLLKLLSVLPLMTVRLPKAFTDLSASQAAAPAQSANLPNVLVFVFDALSASNMPLYGYARNTTPNLARFAKQATLYHNHHAGGNFTTAGTASLLTGVYPWKHRAIQMYGSALDTYKDQNIFSVYPSSGFSFAYTHNLLAEVLLQQFRQPIDLFKRARELAIDDPEYSDRLFPSDYDISLWSEQSILRGGETKPSSLFGSILYRFMRLSKEKQMAEKYGAEFPLGVPNLDEVYFILEDAINWLTAELKAAQTPYLGYFHILPPHAPYCPRKDFVGIFKDNYIPQAKPASPFTEGYTDENAAINRTEYDEYLAYADEEFGRLYDAMQQSGALENTLVIVTADHGESLERGIVGHVTPALYEPLIHIPLLISTPGQTQHQDVTSLTNAVDVLPTLAKFLGQPSPTWSEGQILPGFGEDAVPTDRSIFSVEAKSSPKQGALNKVTVAMLKENYKLIYYKGYKETSASELYDLSADPEELTNLASSKPSVVADMQKEIESQLSAAQSL